MYMHFEILVIFPYGKSLCPVQALFGEARPAKALEMRPEGDQAEQPASSFLVTWKGAWSWKTPIPAPGRPLSCHSSGCWAKQPGPALRTDRGSSCLLAVTLLVQPHHGGS